MSNSMAGLDTQKHKVSQKCASRHNDLNKTVKNLKLCSAHTYCNNDIKLCHNFNWNGTENATYCIL